MIKGLPLFLGLVAAGFSQTNPAIPARETLYYNVEWRLITAGKAKVQWLREGSGWQANVHVESTGLVSKLYRVEDDYSVNMRNNLCAQTSQ